MRSEGALWLVAVVEHPNNRMLNAASGYVSILRPAVRRLGEGRPELVGKSFDDYAAAPPR